MLALPLTTPVGALICRPVAGMEPRLRVMIWEATSPMPLLACTVIVREPIPEPSAVPLRTPLLLKDKPVGNTPPTSWKVGAGKPVATKGRFRETPAVPLRVAALVMAGA